MEAKKSLAQLLDDVAAFFNRKYGNCASYESTQSSRTSKVTPLVIASCPDWARPGLILQPFGDFFVLKLSAAIPDPGFNGDSHGELIELHCSFQGMNVLWLNLNDTLGALGRVMKFEKDNPFNALRLEFINKTHELFDSGSYVTDYVKLEEKVS